MNGLTSTPALVTIVIPTLNEAENIDPLLSAVRESTRGEPFDTEVIVVDDGSTDGTRSRVAAWAKDDGIVLLERDRQRGLAGAVLAGAARARGEVIVVMDADLSHPPERIPELVRPILEGRSDMVIGSRYVQGGSTPGWPRVRRIMSRAASCLAWPLVHVRDPMSGFFAVRRERLLEAPVEATGYKIGLEVMARCGESLRTAEVPIIFTDRQRGQSKLGPGQIFAYLDRLRALAGGSVSGRTAVRFGIVGLVGMVFDILCFQALFLAGVGLASAHIFSFVAATLFNYECNARWSFNERAQDAHEPRWRVYARFLTVAVMALLLRGAVLGALVEMRGWPPYGAIIAAIAAAAAVNYLGNAFFVFPSATSARSQAVQWRVAAIGLVGYLFLLRLLYLGLPDLLVEEAYYWNYAEHPALSYLDHPPMVAWLIWSGTHLFGDTEFGIRVGAVACWFLTAAFAYGTARDLFDKSTAFRAVLLVAVLPFFFLFGFYITPDAPLTACWAGAIFFLQRALLGERRRAWWGVGLCIGLGLLSKYTIALLAPATLIFLLIDRPSRRWLRRPEPFAAAVLALVLFLPVIVWNANNQWASFAFQSVRRLAKAPEFGLPHLVGAMILLLTPLGLVAAVIALLPRRWGGSNLDGLCAAVGSGVTSGRRRLFAAVFTFVPLSVFLLFSLRHEPKLNWAGPLWLAAVPLLAWQMAPSAGACRAGQQAWGGRIWQAVIVASVLAYGVFFHYLTLGLPGIPYPRDFSMVGWSDLGRQVEALEEKLEHKTGVEPLVVGLDKYRIASQLAFYRTRDESESNGHKPEGVLQTAGQHLFGGSSLMYERWFPIDQQAGRTMILVDDELEDLQRRSLARSFERLSPIHPLDVHAGSQITGRFYYRIGYGYRPQIN